MAVIGDAYVVVHAITKGFESEVRRATRGINLEADGANVGQSFTRGFSRGTGNSLSNALGDFGKEAIAARAQFQALVRTGYVLGPVISTLVSGVGALAGGFIALAGAVAGAVPSLVVLPGLFSAIGLSALTAVAAFSGVTKAITAGLKTTTGAKVNTDQLANSQKALARAIEASVEAQEKFTKATRDAKEEIQQLGFDAEDAAIAEKKAAIELEKARATLSRTQDLPPNSQARREAQLAFAEAELNLRKAKDRNRDLAAEQNRLSEAAAKAGTEQYQQTETYKNAQKGVLDALRNQKDAEDALNKAKTGGSSAVDAFQTALNNLSPAAQSFVKFMVNDFIPSLKKLRDAAAQTLLPLVQDGLTRLKNELFPELKGLLASLGTDVGKAFGSVISGIVDAANKADLKILFSQAGYVVQGFGKSVASVYGSILSILAAADPIIRRFSDFLVKKTAEFDKFLNLKQASGQLTAFFNKSGDIAAKWGDVLGNIFSGIYNTVKAIFAPGGAGDFILNWFTEATASFEKFSGSAKGQNYLADYFKAVAVNSRAVLSAIGAFAKEIMKAGADPNVQLFWNTIKESAPAFGNLIRNTNSAAPALAKLVKSFIDFANVTLSSGAIRSFFEVLTTALNAVTKIMALPGMQDFFNAAAKIFAIISAFGLLGDVVGFASKVVVGGFMAMGNALSFILNPMKALGPIINGIRGGILMFSMAFGTAAAPILAIVAAVTAFIAILVLAYNKSEIFRNAVKDLVSAVGGALGEAFTTIKDAFAGLGPTLSSVGGMLKALGDFIGTFIVPIFKVVLVDAIKFAAAVIAGFIKAVISIGSAFGGIANAVRTVFTTVIGIVKAAINALGSLWNNTLGKIKFTLPKVLGFGGGTIGFPTIPTFAQGGTVYPKAGGTIARVAEAGRPERIEPLDAEGLSQRDRALVQLMSGNQKTGDQIFNIYPSPGMNESELASMVSRQIAFQLRRGGA